MMKIDSMLSYNLGLYINDVYARGCMGFAYWTNIDGGASHLGRPGRSIFKMFVQKIRDFYTKNKVSG